MTTLMLENVRIRPALLIAAAGLAWLVAQADVCLARGDGRPATSLRGALMGSEANDGRSRQAGPPVAHYVAGDGDRFILDRSAPIALLRFEHNEEIWALRPTPAPGGDIIYRNDVNQPVLRATRLGGLILFTPHQPFGEAVAYAGDAQPSHLPHVTVNALIQILGVSTLRVGKALGRNVQVRADGKGSEFLFADTLTVVADTLVKMSQLPEGRPYLRSIRGIYIHLGNRMDARLHNGVLDVSVSPRDGIAGRPSSVRIARAIVDAR
jgi:hypothetical protein